MEAFNAEGSGELQIAHMIKGRDNLSYVAIVVKILTPINIFYASMMLNGNIFNSELILSCY